MGNGLKKRYKVYLLEDGGYSPYNEPIKTEKFIKEIDMIVVIKRYENKQDGLSYTTVGNLGLTVDKSIKKGMKITSLDGSTSYTVEFVNNVARLAQVDLKEVK